MSLTNLRWVALSGLLCAPLGCSGDAAPDKPGTDTADVADADADADSDSDSDSDADTDTAGVRFDGAVNTDGGPLAGGLIHFCRGAFCRNGDTDAGGAFVFEGVPPEWHSFEVVADPGYATTYTPLLFGDADRTVDAKVFTLGAASPLGGSATEHAVGDGLYVTAAAGDLVEPLFFPVATEMAGVRVPEADWLPIDEIPGTPLAIWYVSPFNYAAADAGGLPVRITDEWSVPAGEELHLYVGSYDDSVWLDAGVVVSDGADLAGAIPLVSTVLLVRP